MVNDEKRNWARYPLGDVGVYTETDLVRIARGWRREVLPCFIKKALSSFKFAAGSLFPLLEQPVVDGPLPRSSSKGRS
jgi:hypothetical protein